jgi:hypothetical protein
MRTILRVLVFVMLLLAPLDSLSRARPERPQPTSGVTPCWVDEAAALHEFLQLVPKARAVALALERVLAGDVSPLLGIGRRLILSARNVRGLSER